MAFDEAQWSSFLSGELGRGVEVSFGRARRRVIEAEEAGSPRRLRVRMSAFFAGAPPEVRGAVARWLRSGKRARRASAVLDAWIRESLSRLDPLAPRPIVLRTAGRHHDLDRLAGELRARGEPRLERWPRLTWGPRSGSRARRSLQLGCYVPEDDLVRIHPVLDREWVPPWFVRYVLFHELLHAALPAEPDGSGRTVHHGPEFRRRERAFADYARAQAWQRRNLPALLTSARRSACGLEPVPEPPAAAPTSVPPRSAAPRQGLLFAP